MKVKGYKSLQFNRLVWQVFPLGEDVILLECLKSTAIEDVHQSSRLIIQLLGEHLSDIVTAYHSITIFTKASQAQIITRLEGEEVKKTTTQSQDAEVIQVPICYELGLDLERVANHGRISIESLIENHLASTYNAIVIGFTPGFIYADGLNESLACPRLANPRKSIESGSVGIGGNQTGIYALASPGGWNIIGRTPMKLFDKNRKPPMLIEPGTRYQFYRISKEKFESWED